MYFKGIGVFVTPHFALLAWGHHHHDYYQALGRYYYYRDYYYHMILGARPSSS